MEWLVKSGYSHVSGLDVAIWLGEAANTLVLRYLSVSGLSLVSFVGFFSNYGVERHSKNRGVPYIG